MSQRMTEEEATLADKAITAAGWFAPRGESVGSRVRTDWLRARSEEARLLEEAKQKDARIADLEAKLERAHSVLANGSGAIAAEQAKGLLEQEKTIKALADALEAVKRRGLAADDVYEQVNAALRLCGRLK